jgi:hypothetical protein
MTTEKLYKRLGKLLDRSDDADKKHIKKLREVLKALKHRQKELESKLEHTTGAHEQRKLKQDIEVLSLQRKKGVKVYKDLKHERAEKHK